MNFLKLLLQSEGDALLMGSTLLFALLAVIMWMTRKLDWREVGRVCVETASLRSITGAGGSGISS